MTDAQKALEATVADSRRLRSVLSKSSSIQVRSDDEKQVAGATAQTWFSVHRKAAALVLGDENLRPVDDLFKIVIVSSNRATVRKKYLSTLRQIERHLAGLQADHAITLASPKGSAAAAATSDRPPSFSSLISDSRMQQILASRWQECVTCVNANAPLAAVVMMGGILEGLLLARINQLVDKSPIFTASLAPKDRLGKPLKLSEWGLKNFMDVAHEVRWISKTAKDIGEVVRDYRNYIHPQKELSHGIVLSQDDARMLWEVAKNVMVQVLKP